MPGDFHRRKSQRVAANADSTETDESIVLVHNQGPEHDVVRMKVLVSQRAPYAFGVLTVMATPGHQQMA